MSINDSKKLHNKNELSESRQKQYQTVVGLEVHVKINTPEKLLSPAVSNSTSAPNTNLAPFDVGLPGALPTLNKACVEKAIVAALAFGCNIQHTSIFARKQYFYADLPSGYQITQINAYALSGTIFITGKQIPIQQIHLEGDAGRSIHDIDDYFSYVDFNRSGEGLLEIVTKPEIHSAEEAVQCILYIIRSLKYVNVSNCRMAHGEIRADVNISVKDLYTGETTNRVEVKNLNDIENVRKTIEYEIPRHIQALQNQEIIERETRHFDGKKTIASRRKEYASDYRCFPDPDLPPLIITQERIEEIKKHMPELYQQKCTRFLTEYELSEYDAQWLTRDATYAHYYESSIKQYKEMYTDYDVGVAKSLANWIMTQIAHYMANSELDLEQIHITPKKLAQLAYLNKSGVISHSIAKNIFEMMVVDASQTPISLAQNMNLIQINDESLIIDAIQRVMQTSPSQIQEYHNGKTKLLSYFIGETIKLMKGRANPSLVNKLVQQALQR